MPGCLRKLMRWDSAMLLSNPYPFLVACRDAKVGSDRDECSGRESSVLRTISVKQPVRSDFTRAEEEENPSPYSALSRHSVQSPC